MCVYFLYLNFKHDFLNLNKRHKSHNTCFAFHPLLRPLSNVYLRQLDVSVIPSRSLEFPFRSNSRRVSYSAEKKRLTILHTVPNIYEFGPKIKLIWILAWKFKVLLKAILAPKFKVNWILGQNKTFLYSVLRQICSHAVNMT